jgi:hypothetical protein
MRISPVCDFDEYVGVAALGRAPDFASQRYNKCCRSMSYVYDYHILYTRLEVWFCSTLPTAISSAVAMLLISHPRIAQVGPQAPPAPPLRYARNALRCGAGPSCGLPGQSAAAVNRRRTYKCGCGFDRRSRPRGDFYYFFATSIDTSTRDPCRAVRVVPL